MRQKLEALRFRTARVLARLNVLPPQLAFRLGAHGAIVLAPTLCRRMPTLAWLLVHRKKLSPIRPAVMLVLWVIALASAASIYKEALWSTSKCLGFVDLECPGMLDNFVFGTMAAMLAFLSLALIKILHRIEESLNVGLDAFFDTSLGRHGLEIESLRADISIFVRAISLQSTGARYQYLSLIFVIAILVVGFQILVPFNINAAKPSWALRPKEFPILFVIATAWAFFYWIVIIGNGVWISLMSTVGVFGLIRRLSKNSKFIVIPLTPYIKKCFGAFIGLATWNSIALTLIGGIVALLTLKLYQNNHVILLLVALGLILPTLVLVVPVLAVRRAIQRARDNYLQQAFPPISDLFRAVVATTEKRGTLAASDKALLDFLVWERMFGRAERVSVLFINARGVFSAVWLASVQFGSLAKVVGQLRDLDWPKAHGYWTKFIGLLG